MYYCLTSEGCNNKDVEHEQSDYYGCGVLTLFTSSHLQAKCTINVVITDHLGTPQQLVDQNQEVVWKVSYAPFGKATVEVQKVFFNQRFPGQYYDKETGTHYNYYRDYDPSLGRYLQSDPRGILLDYSDPQRQVASQNGIGIYGVFANGDLNHSYSYVMNSPVNYIDPTGEAAIVIPLADVCWKTIVTIFGLMTIAVDCSDGDCPLGDAMEGSSEDSEPEPDKEACEALRQSILNTCYGLTGRKKMACYEAANTSYRQCMGYE